MLRLRCNRLAALPKAKVMFWGSIINGGMVLETNVPRPPVGDALAQGIKGYIVCEMTIIHIGKSCAFQINV